jgi:hypothetical protein
MSSQRRIDSSRANGAKSRGPVTTAGKYNSSRNNLRHGLLAKSAVLEEERSEAFSQLLADLAREHNAQTETQLTLVEHMAMARWRIARLWAIERELLQSEIHKPEHIRLSPTSRVTRAFASLVERDGVFALLNRYEARLDRQYARSLNLLIKLADPDTPLSEFFHSNPVPQSDTSGIGLLACPGDEVASLTPASSAPPDSPTHAESSRIGLPACPRAEGAGGSGPEDATNPPTGPCPALDLPPEPAKDENPDTAGVVFLPPRKPQSQENAPNPQNLVTHLRPTG